MTNPHKHSETASFYSSRKGWKTKHSINCFVFLCLLSLLRAKKQQLWKQQKHDEEMSGIENERMQWTIEYVGREMAKHSSMHWHYAIYSSQQQQKSSHKMIWIVNGKSQEKILTKMHCIQ